MESFHTALYAFIASFVPNLESSNVLAVALLNNVQKPTVPYLNVLNILNPNTILLAVDFTTLRILTAS